MGLVEPLIPSRLIEDYLSAMTAMAEFYPKVAASIVTGVLADLADCLPDDDPWREPGSVSGTWHDGVDLVGGVDIPAEDISLAALAIPLSVSAHNLVTAALAGSVDLMMAWEDSRDLRAATEAIAWLTWRRRTLAGVDDFYVVISFHSWLNRARGGVVMYDEKQLARQRQDAKLVGEF